MVVDNPEKRLGQNDWPNLVGCIVQGSTWQFKGWPYKSETEMFSKMGEGTRRGDATTRTPLPHAPTLTHAHSQRQWRSHDAWLPPRGTVTLAAGFYIRFSDEIPNQKTKGWPVHNLVFSKERTRRHEVGVMMTSFWSTLHTFLQRNRPQLLYHKLDHK